MVIFFTHNNNNINGFDLGKMTWFLTTHINTCKVIYISISLTKLTLPQKSQLKLFLQNVIFFLQSFHNFWKKSLYTIMEVSNCDFFLFCWFLHTEYALHVQITIFIVNPFFIFWRKLWNYCVVNTGVYIYIACSASWKLVYMYN